MPDKHHHDPSNIIKHNGRFYLWYTQHPQKTNGWEGHIRFATSADGIEWTAQGIAIPVGEPGDLDDKAAIISYVVPHDGKYYLFYTAFGKRATTTGVYGNHDAWRKLAPDATTRISMDSSKSFLKGSSRRRKSMDHEAVSDRYASMICAN